MKRFAIAFVFAMPMLLPAWQSGGPSFEVADVKPSDPSVMKMGKGRILPGGQIQVPGYTLRDLIMFSSGATDDMISGGPKWVGEERWDIVAKAPAGAPDTALRGMLQTLLKDRFKLVTHQEEKPMSAYVLTAVKGAAPLQASSASGASQCHWTELDGGDAAAGMPKPYDVGIREGTSGDGRDRHYGGSCGRSDRNDRQV